MVFETPLTYKGEQDKLSELHLGHVAGFALILLLDHESGDEC